MYFVMAALYGMIYHLFFLLTGKIRIVFPSVISIGMGVLMLIGLVLFKGKEMHQEGKEFTCIKRWCRKIIWIDDFAGTIFFAFKYLTSAVIWIRSSS